MRRCREAGGAQAATEAGEDAEGPRAFRWEMQWYPVVPVSYLEGDAAFLPMPMQVLGRRLEVHRGPDGAYTCLAEAHGDLESAQPSRPTAFPTQVAGGLLWVWPDASLEARRLSDLRRPAAVPELASAEWTFQLQPLSYESLVENCLDPSHAPFLHEGLQGQGMSLQDPRNAVPMKSYRLDGEVSLAGFKLQHSPYSKGPETICVRHFRAPSMVDAIVEVPNVFTFRAVLYFVPVAPRETRVMFHFPGYEPTVPEWAQGLPVELQGFVQDVLHASFCAGDVGYWQFNDQDRVAMEGQDCSRWGRSREQVAVDIAPTPSDKGVAVFQGWLRARAGGGPFAGPARGERACAPAGPAPPGPEDAPRWRLHCGHCPRCRRVLRLTEQARDASSAGSLALLLAAAAAAVTGSAGLGVAAGAGALGLQSLSQLAQRTGDLFYRSDTATRVKDVYLDLTRTQSS